MRAILFRMNQDARQAQITARVVRHGAPEPPDDDWTSASPEERIEAVWTLTRLCWHWNQPSDSEPTFHRTVTRVQRAQR